MSAFWTDLFLIDLKHERPLRIDTGEVCRWTHGLYFRHSPNAHRSNDGFREELGTAGVGQERPVAGCLSTGSSMRIADRE